MPLNSAWACPGNAPGSKCSAQCNPGYTARTLTSWASTCSAGAWSTPAAEGTDNMLDCKQNSELCINRQPQKLILFKLVEHLTSILAVGQMLLLMLLK